MQVRSPKRGGKKTSPGSPAVLSVAATTPSARVHEKAHGKETPSAAESEGPRGLRRHVAIISVFAAMVVLLVSVWGISALASSGTVLSSVGTKQETSITNSAGVMDMRTAEGARVGRRDETLEGTGERRLQGKSAARSFNITQEKIQACSRQPRNVRSRCCGR